MMDPERFASAVANAIDIATAPLLDRIKALESRTDALVDRGLEYRGVYEPGIEYKRGDVVTEDGAMWVAKCRTTGRPGVDFASWTLSVARGRPGRPGRDAR